MAYRIRRAPEGRRELPRYYALAGGKVHWTTFKELAKKWTEGNAEEVANHVANKIIHNNGKLAHKITVEPC